MSFKGLAVTAIAVMLVAAGAARAQDGGARIAVCNPAKVFEKLLERQAIQDRINSEREKIKAEAQRRQIEVNDLKKQLELLKPDSAVYQEKRQTLMNKAVEFEVWARLQEQEMARKEKDNIKLLFDKIRDACKEVAESKKIDLVLAERKPDLQNTDQLTPDQVRTLISQSDVLYLNEKADITDPVIMLLNKKYATGTPATGQ